MCYISDWPKRFLKTILLQLSRHQVCTRHARIRTHTQVAHSPVTLTGPQESVVWGVPWLSGVCPFLQVESLIENEAEKDYLYDVLRMYHQ